MIASLAESREKSSSEPVTTTVLPVRVCGRSLVSTVVPTPAARHAFRIAPRQSPSSRAAANQCTTDSAISGPMPSICERSSAVAFAIASSEPNAEATSRAVGGPRRRIDNATSTRHRSACRAFSISSSILRVFSIGRVMIGWTPVPFVSVRTTTASDGTSYPGYAVAPAESARLSAPVGSPTCPSVVSDAPSRSANCLAVSFRAGAGAVQNASVWYHSPLPPMRLRTFLRVPFAPTLSRTSMIGISRQTRTSRRSSTFRSNSPASLVSTGVCAGGSVRPGTGS